MYITEYNEVWKEMFVQESMALRSQSPIAIELKHIGSTAVPNLNSKNCIDILGIIEDYRIGEQLIQPLAQIDYEYRGEYGVTRRHYFSKTSEKKIHFHVFEKGDDNIAKHLHYVNIMRKHPELVEEFNAIKDNLQAKYPEDKTKYQPEKGFFYIKVARIRR